MRSTLTVLALAALLRSSPAVAQDVRGRVESVGAAVPGVLIELVSEEGQSQAATMSGEDGSFLLHTRRPGTYRVRATHLGHEDYLSDSFGVSGQDVFLRVELVIDPIPLEELTATVESGCPVPLGRSPGAYALFQDVLAALRMTAWSESSGVFVFQELIEESGPDRLATGREIPAGGFGEGSDPRLLELMPAPPRTVNVLAPVSSATPPSLRDQGFIQLGDEGSLFYYPPTASVLISQEFIATHCFHAVGGRDASVGISFAPAPGRDVPDVEGVVWYDSTAARAAAVEFSYTGVKEALRRYELPRVQKVAYEEILTNPGLPGGFTFGFKDVSLRGDFGGRLEYERLGDGTEITRRWELRIPILSYYQDVDYETGAVIGHPVALERTRRGQVTAVLKRPMPNDSTGVTARPRASEH